MKKVRALLGSVAAALLMTGCGLMPMPDLTKEETALISEYAVGVLLKYDTAHGKRLVDITGYEPPAPEPEPEPAPPVEQPPEQEEAPKETQAADGSQEQDQAQPVVSSIEQYYGIPNLTIAYQGCEMTDSYAPAGEGGAMFFALDASPGTQLLVLHFSAKNQSGADQSLNMLGYGARFRVSVNGEPSKGALATMLVNDLQTFDGVIPAGGAADLVSIVEVPQGTAPGSIDFILRGGETDGTLRLQ